MCMYVCIQVYKNQLHTCIYTYRSTCLHAYRGIHVCAYVFTYIHTYIYTYMYVYTYTAICRHIHVYTYTYIYIHILVLCVYARMHIHLYTCIVGAGYGSRSHAFGSLRDRGEVMQSLHSESRPLGLCKARQNLGPFVGSRYNRDYSSLGPFWCLPIHETRISI